MRGPRFGNQFKVSECRTLRVKLLIQNTPLSFKAVALSKYQRKISRGESPQMWACWTAAACQSFPSCMPELPQLRAKAHPASCQSFPRTSPGGNNLILLLNFLKTTSTIRHRRLLKTALKNNYKSWSLSRRVIAQCINPSKRNSLQDKTGQHFFQQKTAEGRINFSMILPTFSHHWHCFPSL